MSDDFNLEIIAPDKKIFSSNVGEVVIPSFEGQMTILKDHIPIITFLRPGFVEIKNHNESLKFFIEEGTVEFLNNKMLILTTSAKSLKDFDNTKVSEMIKIVEKAIEAKNLSDKQKYILSYKLSSLKEISQ
tara:strand:+ start:12159 stop:12551 length:393 start_codon:yes stop_codon:yes gene_type:complete